MMKYIKHITNCWAFCGIFALTILIKQILFHFVVFDDCYSGMLCFPLRFYGCAIAIALVLSSFSLLVKRQWWTVVLLFAIDIWFIAQIVYFRSWGIWINVQAILMIDNMSGFWSSILTLLNWKAFIFLGTTILYLPYLVLYERYHNRTEYPGFFRRLVCVTVVLLISYCYVPYVQYEPWIRYEKEHAKVKNPFTDTIRYSWYNLKPLLRPYNGVLNDARCSFRDGSMIVWEDTYIKKHGMIDYAIAMFVFHFSYDNWKTTADTDKPTTLTEDDLNTISLLTGDEIDYEPQRNLIFVLVESFESWVLEYQYDGRYAMPNLRKFMDKHNTFYADKITSQVRGGGSGDGQMILQTGLLPLRSGAACRTYGNNVYPNYAHYFPVSATLNPCPGAWNQPVVNPSYGIKELDENFSLAEDELVFDRLIERIEKTPSPNYVLAITVSTHNPFDKAKEVDWSVDSEMPSNIAKYIKCMHYLDEQFGKLFKAMDESSLFENTDIVISGDHIIFQSMILREFLDYAHNHGIALANDHNYCPLIIYSPTFENSIRYDSIAYQMDIFPTIMYTIGIPNYWWKGFGINLMGNESRVITDEEASVLSDKIIRNNFFAKDDYE